MGHQVPDLDTEPLRPAGSVEEDKDVTDSDLSAPPMPQIAEVGFFDETNRESSDAAKTADIERVASTSGWEESKEFRVEVPRPPRDRKLERKVRWLTLALSVALSVIIGGLFGEYLVPRIVDHVRADELTDERVAKSRRDLTAAGRLGIEVPADVIELQRNAEAAVRAGDVARARAKLEEIDTRWSE